MVEKEKLDNALLMLKFDLIANNEFVRFIPRKELDNNNLYEGIWQIVRSMRVDSDRYQSIELISEEKASVGIYLHFEPYFLQLLLHYQKTGKREFL